MGIIIIYYIITIVSQSKFLYQLLVSSPKEKPEETKTTGISEKDSKTEASEK